MTKSHRIDMPRGLHFFGEVFDRTRALWIKLANLETRLLADDLSRINISQPVYVTGLARSGSTILLELIADHPDIGTHQYRDFPPLFPIFSWNWFLDRNPTPQHKPIERAHKDGIMVTPNSPEAMEEIVWMQFFPDNHNPDITNVLDADTKNSEFELFYQEHIRKVLMVRAANRYASKGNYNIARLGYICRMFPDCRIVLPVRDPMWHIASLIKQHRLFCSEESRDSRILRHMRRVGHYEFGLDLRPTNFGDSRRTTSTQALWESSDEIRGWARYWNDAYRFVLDFLEENQELEQNVLIVRYEDLCSESEHELRKIFDHCELVMGQADITKAASRLSSPAYYTPDFSDKEIGIIQEEVESTAARYGYCQT